MKVNKVVKTVLYCCACAAAIAAGALGGTYYYSASHKAEIMDFTNKNITIAKDWAKKNRVSEQMAYIYVFDEDKDSDIILKQSKKEGEFLGSDEILTLNVSKGANPDKEFVMDDFSGKSEKEIKAWFTTNKFSNVTYEYRYTDDDQYTEGMFLSIKPEGTKKAKRSDHIEIILATKKSEDITIPDLTLYSLENTEAWASENRLSLNTVWTEDDAAYGTILSSDPAAGTTLHTGDVINITVSSGPAIEDTNEDMGAVATASTPESHSTTSTPASSTPTPAPSTPTPAPSTPTPVPSPPTPTPATLTPAPAPVTSEPVPDTPTPEPEPQPSTEPEPEPEPVQGCPASIITSIFTNATANDVIAYYGTQGCSWTVVEYNDSTTNPNNYMGVAGYTKTSANTATLTMFVRWQ